MHQLNIKLVYEPRKRSLRFTFTNFLEILFLAK